MELRPGVGELVKQAQVQMRLAKEARRVRVVAAVRGEPQIPPLRYSGIHRLK